MGYLIECSLEIGMNKEELEKNKEKIIEVFLDETKLDEDEIIYLLDCGIEVNWSEYKENLKNISEKFKDILFTLYCDGEEKKDIWVHYFLNGKEQFEEAKITYGKCVLK